MGAVETLQHCDDLLAADWAGLWASIFDEPLASVLD